MNEKLTLRQVVIVEGRYDKIRLESILEALILPVNGFAVFTDREMRRFISKMAKERGIIILTDSDAAGFCIRNFLRGSLPAGSVTDVYIPDIFGKEKRKSISSKEGKLGVEGMSREILLEAFHKAGIEGETVRGSRSNITRADLYEDGLFGGENSRALRYALYDKLGLPRRLNVTAALDILERMLTREEYRSVVKEIRRQVPNIDSTDIND